MQEQNEYKRVIEAALFMSSNALSVADLVNVTGVASPGLVTDAVRQLASEYNTKDTALQIIEIDGRYLMAIKEPYAAKVSSLAVGPDISRPALRILAYVNKNPGIVQSDIVKAFGSSTYDYMKELTEKEFIETKKFGRTRKILTTNKFKEYFNV